MIFLLIILLLKAVGRPLILAFIGLQIFFLPARILDSTGAFTWVYKYLGADTAELLRVGLCFLWMFFLLGCYMLRGWRGSRIRRARRARAEDQYTPVPEEPAPAHRPRRARAEPVFPNRRPFGPV